MPATSSQLDVLLIHQESFYIVDGYQANLGVLYVATALEKQGFSVKVMANTDLFLLRNSHLERIFSGYRPALVGFYTMTDNIHHVVRLARRIKQWSPQSALLAGGPLASALGEELGAYFHFDYIIKGEGEYSAPALADYVCRGQGRLEDIPGLLFSDGASYASGAPASYIDDLDALPDPDRDLVNRSSRLNISSGRGCPNSCTFCFQSVHGKGYRFRSAARVAQEVIDNLEQYGYRAFDIIDDTFVAEPDRVLDFCHILSAYRKRTGRDFIWYCEARVDTLSQRPELLKAMKDTGLIRLQVGIESGDDETLRRYGKRLDLVKLKELCALINEIDGISIFGNFIIGGPYESQESFERSSQLVKELIHLAPGLFEANSGFLAPYPQTPIGRRPELFGLQVEDSDYLTSITPEDCYCSTPSLSRPQLRRLRYQFVTDMTQEMCNILPQVPKQRLLRHYHWFKKYNTQTRWLTTVMQAMPAVNAYFNYYDNAKFAPLDNIPQAELMEWIPFRTIPTLQYDTDNWEDYLLSGSYEDLALRDPLEKDIYALSVGKLSIGELLEALSQRHHLQGDRRQLWEEKVRPVFKRLEEHFQLIFHE